MTWGEQSGDQKVYIIQLSTTIQVGKIPSPLEDMIISFFEEDMTHVTTIHDDTIVITVEIDKFDKKRILLNTVSSMVILFLDAFKSMGRSKKEFKKLNFPLIKFAGSAIYAL